MATEIHPTSEYLRQFPNPLWNLLDLEECKPRKIVEGQREGASFIIIELQHLAFGLFAENRNTSISTFFIVAHGKSFKNPQVSQFPQTYQVSVDSQYLYLVSPSKKISPSEWDEILAQAIKVANLVSESPTVGVTHQAPQKTYRPVGPSAFVHRCWMLVGLLLAIIFFLSGLAGLFGMAKLAPSYVENLKLSLQCLLVSVFFLLGSWISYTKMKKRL